MKKDASNMTFYDRVDQRLQETGQSAAAVSVKIGRSRDFLRTFKRGNSSFPRADDLTALAKALGTTERWLLGVSKDGDDGAEPSNAPQAGRPSPKDIVGLLSKAELPRDVPVFGTAAGSLDRGSFVWSGGEAVDYVRRPPALMGASSVYALYVEGTSMEPQFFAGDLIFIHPGRPARPGDIVVVMIRFDEGQDQQREASLGLLKSREPDEIRLEKRNPAGSIIEMKSANIEFIHRVLSNNELYGL